MSLNLNFKIERVGKYFFLKLGNNIAATIDLQKVTGLSDEETAQLVARLDENKATGEVMQMFEDIEPKYSKTNSKLAEM